MTDEWITHESDEPPELAPAVLVGVDQRAHDGNDGLVAPPPITKRVDRTLWIPGLKYRVLRNPDGHPYVSAEGLERAARFVTTDEDGQVIQWYVGPPTPQFSLQWDFEGDQRYGYAEGPASHRHPGDWRDSLHAVWREDHE